MAFPFACVDANAAIYLKCSGVYVVTSFIQSCRFLIQYHLKDQRLLAFNLGFQSGSIHAKNSLDTLNLLVVLSIVDCLNSLKMCSKKCLKLLDCLLSQYFVDLIQEQSDEIKIGIGLYEVFSCVVITQHYIL